MTWILLLLERLWDESMCQSLAIVGNREIRFVMVCGLVERKSGASYLS